MSRQLAVRLIVGAAGFVLLVGCEGASPTASGAATSSSTDRPSTTKLVEQDVEAPDVFQVTEAALWDGRPSLGGVWVAYPGVTEPERVIIRNTETGVFVIGALFKRERDNPGPKIQVSSDAASALGVLAGSPTDLNITALRREDQADEAPAASDEETEVAEAEAEPELEPEAEPEIAEAPAPQAEEEETAVAQAETEATDGEVDTAPKRKGPFAWLKPKDPEPALEAAEEITTAALDPIESAAAAIDRVEAEAVTPAPEETVAETAALELPDTVQMEPEVSPAEDTTRRWSLFRKREPGAPADPTGLVSAASSTIEAAAVTSVQTSALAPAPRPSASRAETTLTPKRAYAAYGLRKPFIQIGIFSLKENADRMAETLRGNGIVPTVYDQESSGKQFWRVVVGPATSRAERSELLETVKSLGYSDAYFVSN